MRAFTRVAAMATYAVAADAETKGDEVIAAPAEVAIVADPAPAELPDVLIEAPELKVEEGSGDVEGAIA